MYLCIFCLLDSGYDGNDVTALLWDEEYTVDNEDGARG